MTRGQPRYIVRATFVVEHAGESMEQHRTYDIVAKDRATALLAIRERLVGAPYTKLEIVQETHPS